MIRIFKTLTIVASLLAAINLVSAGAQAGSGGSWNVNVQKRLDALEKQEKAKAEREKLRPVNKKFPGMPPGWHPLCIQTMTLTRDAFQNSRSEDACPCCGSLRTRWQPILKIYR